MLAALLSVLATIAILATLLTTCANRVLVSPRGFTSRAVHVLHVGAVQSLVAQTISDRLISGQSAQSTVEPLLRAAVVRTVSSHVVDREFRAAARSLHRQLVSGTAERLRLTLPGIGPAIASSLGSADPRLGEAVRSIGTITVLDVPIPRSDANAVHDLVRAGRASSELLIVTLALMLLALLISPQRRRTLAGLGLGAALSGVVVVVVYLAGRALVVDAFSSYDARTAAHAVWGVYLGTLETWGLVLAGAGLVTACAARLAPSGRSAKSA